MANAKLIGWGYVMHDVDGNRLHLHADYETAEAWRREHRPQWVHPIPTLPVFDHRVLEDEPPATIDGSEPWPLGHGWSPHTDGLMNR